LLTKYCFVSAGAVSIFGLMLVSNTVSMMFATGVFVIKMDDSSNIEISLALKWGSLMGLLNFVGFYSFLRAIKFGDFSIVVSLNALYILIPVVLSNILYEDENLNWRQKIAVGVSILAVVLIKLSQP